MLIHLPLLCETQLYTILYSLDETYFCRGLLLLLKICVDKQRN